jgi:ubiquinone/menaquinone biosynthesis C-methylase UbiE
VRASIVAAILRAMTTATHLPPMRLAGAEPGPFSREIELAAELLPLQQARILELGCGRAEFTRALADRFPASRITAMEVDAIQHAKNQASERPANVAFAPGGADAIPLPDACVDVVLMLKSLHHVPVGRMDAALAEISRVLAPGGLAYFSEPIYAGEFNAIMSMFHDERVAREAAFAALSRAVASGRFELVAERFWRARRRYAGFAEFDERMIGATHTCHRLSAETHAAVRERFERHLAPDGTATFDQPMRVDVLRRRA